MKTLFTAFFCLAVCVFIKAQSTDLTGTYDIIEFGVISEENTNIMNEAQLTESGSVWSLFFMEEDKFKQTSNMRDGSMESHEGTWKVTDDVLTLELHLNDRLIPIEYTFNFSDGVLVLTRGNPMGTMKIVTRFRRK